MVSSEPRLVVLPVRLSHQGLSVSALSLLLSSCFDRGLIKTLDVLTPSQSGMLVSRDSLPKGGTVAVKNEKSLCPMLYRYHPKEN
jgi:hypothetical protein